MLAPLAQTSQPAFAVGQRDELLAYNGKRLRVYEWGQARPKWERSVETSVRAVALTPRAVYYLTSEALYELPRTPHEPTQRYLVPRGRIGAPAGVTVVGKQAIVWSEGGRIGSANLPEEQWQVLSVGRGRITAAAVCGSWVLAAEDRGEACLIERGAWREVGRWACGLGGVVEWQYHAGRQWVVGACVDGLVKVWALEKGQLVHAFASHRWGATRLAWRKGGTELASWGEDGGLWFYDVERGRVLTERFVQAPREVRGALAMRWLSEGLVELWTGDAFWSCRLPAGEWRKQQIT